MLRRHFINISYNKEILPNLIWYKTSNGKSIDFNALTLFYTLNFSITPNFELVSNILRLDGWWCLSFLEPIFNTGIALTSDGDEVMGPVFMIPSDNTGYLRPTNIYNITEIQIPYNVSILGEVSFKQAPILSIAIPNSVTSIESSAFEDCRSLTSITIPNSVTSIGKSAFSWCSSLTSITIPNSVTSIGAWAFGGCSSLTSVNITDLAAWCKISFGDYSANPLSSAHNLYLNGELVKELVIPNSVTSIRNNAFSGCTSLTSITIPESVTSIGQQAFQSCTGLTSITIPNSVTSMGDDVFNGCTSLTSVTIGNSVMSIGEEVFRECLNLTSVTIGNSVASIGWMAFYNCKSLTSIEIPNSVTSIEEGAFYNCSSLAFVNIPNSVTSIEYRTFYNCSSLKSIVIPNNVTRISTDAFSNCESLDSIIFEGTIEQYNALTKYVYWCNNVPATVVHCSDGDAEILRW